MTKPKYDHTIAAKLPGDAIPKLDAAAAAQYVTRSTFVRLAVMDAIKSAAKARRDEVAA